MQWSFPSALTAREGSGYNDAMSIVPYAPPRLLTIAIDGPAGAGKSTVARAVAARLGYTYLDTGAMYRALAWAAIQQEIGPDNPDAVITLADAIDIHLESGSSESNATRVFVNGREITDEIRTPQISAITSPLSAIPEVRTRMVAIQKRIAEAGGIVMEGRDIGTVVMPDAEVKIFLTASSRRRAERRAAELAERGTPVDFNQLLRDIEERDARDGGRAVAPMVPAPDAVILDSDPLTAEDVIDEIIRCHAEARARHA